jgi:Trk K+ transport system NAD-binding subunit
VVLIDTDPEACRLAEQENFRVFLSSALDTRVLEEAGLASVGTFLAMTNNGEVNYVLAQRADEEFQPPRVLAVFPRDPQTSTLANTSNKVRQAFVPDLPIKTWNEYLSDGRVKLGTTTLKEPFAFQQAHLQALMLAGELVPLLLEREERFQVLPATEEWQPGDRLIYLLHDPRPMLLKRLSGERQSTHLAVEKLPEVEEVPIQPSVLEAAVDSLLQQ